MHRRENEYSYCISIINLHKSLLHLTFPHISHKSRYLDMIEEWKSYPDPRRNPGRLFVWENYEDFLEIIKKDLTNNERGINGILFFFMDNEDILGAIQVRHSIDHPNCSLEWWCGGHIGYGLRPSERGKWLAKAMLLLWLTEAKKLGIEKVLISAHTDNPASWKVIELCGGEFIKEIDDKGKKLKVYEIRIFKKSSRKELRSKIRADKMKEKIDRKAIFRRKTEKKLAEKAERKITHKKSNAQKKLQLKLEKRKISTKT